MPCETSPRGDEFLIVQSGILRYQGGNDATARGDGLRGIESVTVKVCRASAFFLVGGLLAGSIAGCSGNGYDKGKYCAAVGMSTSGAMDENGGRLDQFGPEDKRRSYLAVAKLGPRDYRSDWEAIAESFKDPPDLAASLRAIEAERRVDEQVKTACGIDLRTF